MSILQRVLLVRGLRGFADGCISLVLPFYLISLGLSALEVGIITTATMLGSGVVSIGVGFNEHRHGTRVLLCFAALLMSATGAGFFLWTDFWPLLVIAFVGTINPSNGDVTLFLPLEHATIAGATESRQRAGAFAKYSLFGSGLGAAGALAAGFPQWFSTWAGISMQDALKLVFAAYGVLGIVIFFIYRSLPRRTAPPDAVTRKPLQESRGIVLRLTAVFALDSFSSGFVAQSMLALWLFQRFDLPIATAGGIFFWSGLLSAASYPVAAALARRIGAVRTMVYTQIPAIAALMLVPFMPGLSMVIALMMARALFASMDSPVRSAFVMNTVPANERAAAASITTMPKSLAASVGPSLSGWMLSLSNFGWPLVVAGGIKLVYLFLLFRLFHDVEEQQARKAGTKPT